MTTLNQHYVLVVDDDQDAGETLAELLDSHGFHSRWVGSGMEALESAQQSPPYAILVDLAMPEMDGFETCIRLREFLHPNVFIASLSGWSRLPKEHAEKLTHFDAHFIKPIELSVLQKALSALAKPTTDGTVPSR